MNKWRNILATHGVREILMLFNNVFLGIYFLKLTSGNMVTVATYYLIYYTIHILWRYLVGRMINNKNIVKIYRFSMFTNLSVSIILLVLGPSIVEYIYLFAMYYALSQCLYWTTYSVMIYELNEKENFKKYFSYDSMIANVSAIIFPVLFGIVLTNYSYTFIFAMLSIIALISFILSFTIKDVPIKCEKIKLRESIKKIKDKKLIGYVGLESILNGLTHGGVIKMLTTLIIFTKFENESFIGIISSVIGIGCIFAAIFSRKKINKANFLKVVFPVTFALFLITIPISFQTSLICVVMYKVLIEISDVLTNIEGNTVTFEGFKNILDARYKVDYQWFIELTIATGRAIGLIGIIIISIITNNNIAALTILFIYFTTFYMLRTIVIQKIRKRIEDKNKGELKQ